MTEFLGFGDGSSGAGSLSGTDAPVDSTITGTSGTNTGSGETGKAFAANDICLIVQLRGGAVLSKEVVQIASYNSGSGAFVFNGNLENTYTTGAVIVKGTPYSSVDISSTFTVKAWDGSKGGFAFVLCKGRVNIASNIVGTGMGFRGQAGVTGASQTGGQGEGTSGLGGTQSTSANGNGGGGGGFVGGASRAAGGGGGSNAVAGSSGDGGGAGATPGTGASIVGSNSFDGVSLGGGGGSGGTSTVGGGEQAGTGGNGGGMVFILAQEIVVTGGINVDGAAGTNPTRDGLGGGGGGAGGSIYLIGVNVNIGTNLLSALGKPGGPGTGGGPITGGAGGNGYIHVEGCTVTGSAVDGTVSIIQGGQSFCSVSHCIL